MFLVLADCTCDRLIILFIWFHYHWCIKKKKNVSHFNDFDIIESEAILIGSKIKMSLLIIYYSIAVAVHIYRCSLIKLESRLVFDWQSHFGEGIRRKLFKPKTKKGQQNTYESIGFAFPDLFFLHWLKLQHLIPSIKKKNTNNEEIRATIKWLT